MTVPYPQVLSALKVNATAQLRGIFEPLSVADATELGTFIGPVRLRAVTLQPVVTTAFKPGPPRSARRRHWPRSRAKRSRAIRPCRGRLIPIRPWVSR